MEHYKLDFSGLTSFAHYARNNTLRFAEGDKISDILQLIVNESEEIEKVSEQLAEACTEPRLTKV